MSYANLKKLNETIRPCVCMAKAEANNSMYAGMPALIPTRNDDPERYPHVYWEIKCPRCGRGGILQFKTVNAAIKHWNKMQDDLWKSVDGFNLPFCYPFGEDETYEPLYKRYHELIREIGYGYLLGLSAEEKAPLMEYVSLLEKIPRLEAVLAEKKRKDEEHRRAWEMIDDFMNGSDE